MSSQAEESLAVQNIDSNIRKIALAHCVLRNLNNDYENALHFMQKRLKAGREKLDMCMQESRVIDLKLSAIEGEILNTGLQAKDIEDEAKRTAETNRNMKRKLAALTSEVDSQKKKIQEAHDAARAYKESFMKKKKRTNVANLFLM